MNKYTHALAHLETNLFESVDCFNTLKSRLSGIAKLKEWNALQATKGAFYCGIYFSQQTSIQRNGCKLLLPVTAQWHRPGPGNRDPHKPFYDCDNAVNTQKDKNHTYREMTTHTGRETLKEQMIFSTLWHPHTHLGFCYYHINWWGNDVSNDMLNGGWGGCLVISSRNVHFGRRQRWGWTDDNARRWHVWTLNDLPDKVIHHIWNVLWQSPRDGSRHHPASISQKAQPPGHGERLRADDGWAPFISRPNVNREESFKLKCEQRWQPDATAGLPLLNMQPFGLVSPFFPGGGNNVRWYKVARPVCTQNYKSWLNRKALWAEEGSCLRFTSASGRPGDL